MTFNEFHNGLRILCWGIDRREVDWMSSYQWLAFNKNAPEFFVRANDADAKRIWAVIKARQLKRAKPGDDVDDIPDEELPTYGDTLAAKVDAMLFGNDMDELLDDEPEPPTYDDALAAKADADVRYVRDMMDAGRGHLLRK